MYFGVWKRGWFLGVIVGFRVFVLRFGLYWFIVGVGGRVLGIVVSFGF